MAKKCVLRFSGDDVAVNGKSLEVEISNDVEKNIARSKVNGAKPEDIDRKDIELLVKDSIKSKREAEKIILDSMIRPLLKDAKKVSAYNILLDIIETIENAEDSVILDKEDLEKIKDGFEKVEPKDRPAFWGNCRELFKQLESPEEVPDEKVTVKKDDEKKK